MAYLKKHLDTDWEKLKGAWIELKNKQITTRECAKRALTSVGKRFLQVVAGKFKV